MSILFRRHCSEETEKVYIRTVPTPAVAGDGAHGTLIKEEDREAKVRNGWQMNMMTEYYRIALGWTGASCGKTSLRCLQKCQCMRHSTQEYSDSRIPAT